MSLLLIFPLIAGFLGEAPPADADKPEEAAAHLKIMKQSVSEYQVRSTEDRAVEYQLRPDPILRFTNTVGASKDGAVYLWLGEHDRPAAAVQVFLKRDGHWWHELTSFLPNSLTAETRTGLVWNPNRGGVQLKPLPGAPKPAATEEQRLMQMRALTREFVIEDNFRENGWQSLRMLTKPFARYGKPGAELIDGALFCYVLTTDPEVYLMIEARTGKDGPEWQYALAPMTIYPVRASWKGKEVWSLPYRFPIARDAREPFHLRPFEPEG